MKLTPICAAGQWKKDCIFSEGKSNGSCTVPLSSTWIQINGENRWVGKESLQVVDHYPLQPQSNKLIREIYESIAPRKVEPVLCQHAFKLLQQTTEARSLRYAHGALWWYGGVTGMSLRRMTLDKALPCSSLGQMMKHQLEKKWCTDQNTCASHTPEEAQVAHLMEDMVLQPWSLTAYKKNSTPKGLVKTLLCSHPTRPTTRHSPEVCCSWKNSSKWDYVELKLW